MRKVFLLFFVLLSVTGYSFAGIKDGTPPATPSFFTVKAFEKHIDIRWGGNTESDLVGYNLYKLTNGSYVKVSSFGKYDLNLYQDKVGQTNITASYKISAFNLSNLESPLSDSITVTTHQMTDEQFLDMVQEATFRYFYDFAHPNSGLTREGLTHQSDIVTSGGSGFGIMALLVGIERGYITREQGITRMLKILNFLTNADRFHGAWSHWINGNTGRVIPFSTYDNGGDLVETSYLVQGLLSARQYFSNSSSDEDSIRAKITNLWETVEWDYYRRSPYSNCLYWHWSPNYNWQMNMPITGYMEAMITYLLATASPTHRVPSSLFKTGWEGSGYRNGNSYYGIPLFVGPSYSGPLFFYHYSFLGFDPRFKKDTYANYFENNKNASLIHRQYCIVNPRGQVGYADTCWGLTASDGPNGYSEHRPYSSNDDGTISPTAGISSIPYVPQYSIELIKSLYRNYVNNLWGPYGFKDAFNLNSHWYSNTYLAIDQGPEIVMIENYRSNLLWNKFMSNPEISPMLDSLGFIPDSNSSAVNDKEITAQDFRLMGNYPNPFNPGTTIKFTLASNSMVDITIYNILGKEIKKLSSGIISAGSRQVYWDGKDNSNCMVNSGVYIYSIKAGSKVLCGKMILQK